jgi:malate dehydrogenase (oxaloacetate-decarboxylating)
MVQLTPNPSYSITVQVQIPNQSGMLARVVQAIGEAGGSIGDVDVVRRDRTSVIRDITIDAASQDHADAIVQALKDQLDIQVLSVKDRTFELHQGGKLITVSKLPLQSQDELAMAYTPGVGRICMAIAQDPDRVYELTIKKSTVAVITDGSAVLGLGNIGPEAALPVMEGKALLFREFGQLNAFPICLATQDVDEIVETVKRIAPVFGGINLEDISAPRCFEIETRLQRELNIPVFHDDQHGTAIVVLAALTNALKVVGKSLETVRIVINGAGAAGISIARLLQKAGATTLWLCDRQGILSKTDETLTPEQRLFAIDASGSLTDALKDADVCIGVSAPGVITPDMLRVMAKDAIVFAMANPVPEIQPELAKGLVAVMATGRSDYPNQINNVLAFPGIFRGALNCRAAAITTTMHLEAAHAIAALVSPQELTADHIIPSVFDPRVATAVAAAVEQAAREEGVAQG